MPVSLHEAFQPSMVPRLDLGDQHVLDAFFKISPHFCCGFVSSAGKNELLFANDFIRHAHAGYGRVQGTRANLVVVRVIVCS